MVSFLTNMTRSNVITWLLTAGKQISSCDWFRNVSWQLPVVKIVKRSCLRWQNNSKTIKVAKKYNQIREYIFHRSPSLTTLTLLDSISLAFWRVKTMGINFAIWFPCSFWSWTLKHISEISILEDLDNFRREAWTS